MIKYDKIKNENTNSDKKHFHSVDKNMKLN